jgi:CheY-like chemotaxis protein
MTGTHAAIEVRDRHTGPLSILLAEDDPANQKVTSLMLRKLGYHADIAGNGNEVLTALESRSYDLVLMDIQMPEMDGMQAAQIIRRRWPQGPRIVFVTACTSCRDACLQEGGDGFLAKPVSLMQLREAIDMGYGLSTQPASEPGSPPSSSLPASTSICFQGDSINILNRTHSIMNESAKSIEDQAGPCGIVCAGCPLGSGAVAEGAGQTRKNITDCQIPMWSPFVPGGEAIDWAAVDRGLEWAEKYARCAGCESGGGPPDCTIRICARDRGYELCSSCGDLETCDKFQWLKEHGEKMKVVLKACRGMAKSEFIKKMKDEMPW